MRTSGTDGGRAGAGPGPGEQITTGTIEGTGTGRPGPVRRSVAAAVALLAFGAGAASAVLGARYVPSLEDWSAAPAAEGGLYVHAEWPLSACSPVALAGMSGVPPPTDRDGTERPLGTAELATLAPPVAYRQGWLVMTLSATVPGTVGIDDVDVEVFRADEDSDPDWALVDEDGGCGPSPKWLMDAVLADGKGELVDRGPSQVSRSDPADVHVHVTSCDRYYEFGLVIAYTVGGEHRVERVGSREQPFRITGGTAPERYVSSGFPGPDQLRPGQDLLFPTC